MGKIWATSLLEKILETHPLSTLPHPPSPLYKAEGGGRFQLWNPTISLAKSALDHILLDPGLLQAP